MWLSFRYVYTTYVFIVLFLRGYDFQFSLNRKSITYLFDCIWIYVLCIQRNTTIIKTSAEKLKVLRDYFSSVFTTENTSQILRPSREVLGDRNMKFDDVIITETLVIVAIDNLKQRQKAEFEHY